MTDLTLLGLSIFVGNVMPKYSTGNMKFRRTIFGYALRWKNEKNLSGLHTIQFQRFREVTMKHRSLHDGKLLPKRSNTLAVPHRLSAGLTE
jgi:hypothetical protein